MKELSLTVLETPLVYSLHYAWKGRRDGDDELPSKAVGRMKKQKKAGATSKRRKQLSKQVLLIL